MKASIISIGDELILGQTVDSNSAWLSGELAQMGIMTSLHLTAADELDDIVRVLAWGCEHTDLVLVSGGLGPTDDDLTRDALAKLLGTNLIQDDTQKARLEAFFANRNRPMSPRNLVQVTHPVGSTMITNTNGTAPGIHATHNGVQVFLMPGVPSEMRTMFNSVIKTMIHPDDQSPRAIVTGKINTFGMGESDVAVILDDLMTRGKNPLVGTTVTAGICSIRVRGEYANTTEASAQVESIMQQVEQKMGTLVFSRGDTTLEQTVVDELLAQHKTLATAESCTGGLIGKLITDVPGSSAAYAGGFVTYSNAMKSSLLNVPTNTLDKHGAVSAETVQAMALGAIQQTGTDLAISVSGIAGPDGGTSDKPVGIVWFGIATRKKTHIRTITGVAHLLGDRKKVRDRAAKLGLQAVRLTLLNEPIELIGWLGSLQETKHPIETK
ncbi:competence/damage-inducible protein A [Poriferisphaera sp. WC338]|uniref:competence/damage-inducible protein A n=1 Tax=Poriferisphaera sp. WC338 TaxID=3425129 RepID=UPI003D8156A5